MSLSRRTLLTGVALAPIALAAPALTGRAGLNAEPAADTGLPPQIIRQRIGSIEVTALFDGTVTFTPDMLAGYEAVAAAEAAQAAYKRHDGSTMVLGINGYLIRTGDRLIAVDCGAPPAMGPTVGRWHDALAAAGASPETLDTLVLTHLHPDHVGGMTDLATGTALLPKTRVIAGAVDWTVTHDDGVYAQTPDAFKPFVETSRALLAPYADRAELIEAGAEIAPGVTTLALPGHTPGQMGIRIDDGGESLLIWADLLHSPAYQFAYPDWSLVFDADPALAAETRRKTLDMAAADRLMVAGMHLDMPGFGHVEAAGDAWRYVAAPPDYRI